MSSFVNDGGPLIALDLSAAGEWQGAGDIAGGDIPPGSDYARACAAGYPADLADVAWTKAAVLGAQEGISNAYWLTPSGSASCYLIGAVFSDDTADEALAVRLAGVSMPWRPIGHMQVPSGRLALFHAACSGADLDVDPDRSVAFIGDALTLTIRPGSYALSAAEVAIGDRGLFNIVRWEPTAP